MILPEDLECVRFLRELPPSYLREVARMAHLLECQKGDVLFREGEASSVMYFILDGEVRLEIRPDDEPIEVYAAGPGEFVGWSPLLGGVMSATGHVTARTRVAALEVSRVLRLCQQDERFGQAFFRQVSCFLSDRLISVYRCLAFSRALRQGAPFALSHSCDD